MKIRHRIAFSKETVSPTFISFLKEKNAKFDRSSSYIGVAYIGEKICIDSTMQNRSPQLLMLFTQRMSMIVQNGCLFVRNSDLSIHSRKIHLLIKSTHMIQSVIARSVVAD